MQKDEAVIPMNTCSPAGNVELNHGHITRLDIFPRTKKTPNYRINVVSINRSEYRVQEPNLSNFLIVMTMYITIIITAPKNNDGDGRYILLTE